ncbi:LuxR C-terminal-related transcriptional regulator [Parafrankia sp. FMc6]|uniref:helix-turn-helix transcriptional regulator n=1 Tax=Parafrankia soli TaxID=2599596 RepID=UPI0034D6F382
MHRGNTGGQELDFLNRVGSLALDTRESDGGVGPVAPGEDRAVSNQQWPMAARASELAAVVGAVRRGTSVVLVGEPGVGKTRLLRTALAEVATAGDPVRLIDAPHGTHPDLPGSLLAELSATFDLLGGDPLEGGPTGGFRPRDTEHRPGGPDARPRRVFGSAGLGAARPDHGFSGTRRGPEAGGGNRAPARFPPAAGTAGRVVLGVDDAHLLDSEPAAMLHHLVATGRVTLVAAVCSGENQHRGVSRLWMERLAERFDLAEFNESGVHAMVRARLGGTVDESTLARLHHLTRGNALYLCELVGHALAEGTLVQADGIWRWSGLASSGGRLSDLVRLRLADLAPDEVELVAMVALAEPLEADLPVVAELAAAAESLNRRRIIVAEGVGRRVQLRLFYPLHSEVLVASLPELTARRLRARLAGAIEQTGLRRRTDLLRAVRLRLDAGQMPEPAHLIAAAERAVGTGDVVFAERLCRLAIAVREPTLSRSRIELLLGRALCSQGRHSDAEDVFGPGCDHAPREELAALARTRALNMAGGLGRIDDAEALLAAVRSAVPAADEAKLSATLAIVWMLADRLPEALTLVGSAIAGENADSPLVREAVPVMAVARTELGDAAGALELLDSCLPALDRWADHHWLPHRLATVAACVALGRMGDASATLRRVRRRLADGPSRVMWDPLTVLVEAHHLRLTGRNAEAVDLLRRSDDSAAAASIPDIRCWTRAQLAGALAEAGSHADALVAIAEARALVASTGGSTTARGWVTIEEAAVHAHAGDRARAVALALELADRFVAAGRIVRAVEALHLAARLGVANAVVARCEALATRIGAAEVAQAWSAHVRALAGADGDALSGVSRRFEDMCLLPLAAEAAVQAAAAYQMRGAVRSGRLARVRGADLVSRCGGPLPPWASDEVSVAAGAAATRGGTRSHGVPGPELTPREREVAAFAAVGLSNREIASRLVVSVRTVENHLQRAYGKLGVLRRADLALRLQESLESGFAAGSAT